MARYVDTDALSEKKFNGIQSVNTDAFSNNSTRIYQIGWNDAIDAIVENEPTADVPQWIPCSERLPEDIRPVLVTWKNTDPASYYQYIVGKHFIGTAHYHRGKWYWYSSVTEDLLAEYGKCESEEFDEAIEAVAWMPLPEPYEENGCYACVHDCVDEIEKLPSAQTEQRWISCGDCKHYKIDHPRANGYHCCYRMHSIFPMKPDDFCSYAERREE